MIESYDKMSLIDEDKSFKNTVLVVAALAAFFPALFSTSVVLALPAIGREFNANAIEMGWIMNSFSFSIGIFMLITGRLGDIVGRKKLFLFGMLLFTFSTAFTVFSRSIYILIIFRVLQGLSHAIVFSTIMAIVSVVFKTGERGKAVGINLTATYLGVSLGPFFGGLLTQYLGWRSLFLFLLPFQILTLILIKYKIKAEWADSAGEKFDYKGSLAFGLFIFGSMYGFSLLPSMSGWIFFAGGLLFGVLFVFIELRVDHPVLEIRLFSNRMFAFSCMSSIFAYSATSAIGFFSSLYLQYLKGFDSTTAGLIMISQPLAMTLLSTLAGKISDKKNPAIIVSIGFGIISLGLALFWFINENSAITYMISLLVIIGVGFGLFSSPNSNAIMSSVDKKYLGIASGTLGTVRTIGQMLGMGIALMLFSFYIGREQITPSIYPDLLMAIRAGFLVFAFIAAAGIFVSLARNKRNNIIK